VTSSSSSSSSSSSAAGTATATTTSTTTASVKKGDRVEIKGVYGYHGSFAIVESLRENNKVRIELESQSDATHPVHLIVNINQIALPTLAGTIATTASSSSSSSEKH